MHWKNVSDIKKTSRFQITMETTIDIKELSELMEMLTEFDVQFYMNIVIFYVLL